MAAKDITKLWIAEHFFLMADPNMRIAVAGSNALALMIATYIVRTTSHRIVVFSRNASPASSTPVCQNESANIYLQQQPHLANEPYQLMVVDYNSQASLQHAVMGVDTIISTITGDAQLNLLRAAITRRVRRFAPAEFEGPLENRAPPEHLDRGRSQVRDMLEEYRGHVESTIFNCGVLYERFAPGGLHNYRMALNTYRGAEGDFIINPRNLSGETSFLDSNGEPITVCLTAAQDVARLVVRSLDLPTWPTQLYMTGEKLTISELIMTILRARGESYSKPDVTWHWLHVVLQGNQGLGTFESLTIHSKWDKRLNKPS
jgi:hypothetical protein